MEEKICNISSNITIVVFVIVSVIHIHIRLDKTQQGFVSDSLQFTKSKKWSINT